jgi:hypothetical protein
MDDRGDGRRERRYSDALNIVACGDFIYLVVHLLWDSLHFSRLAPDDKTVELLLLRQQLLIVRRHQKRGLAISRTEKLLVVIHLARENRWGDDRINDELKKLGYRVSHEKVRQILRSHEMLPTLHHIPIR